MDALLQLHFTEIIRISTNALKNLLGLALVRNGPDSQISLFLSL